jgi:hypothetical protein
VGRRRPPKLRKTASYFVFGEAVAAGLTSLLTFVPSGFFTSGEAPGFAGGAAGEALGDATGLAVAAGLGVATGGLFSGALVFGSQAPNTATLAAKTVANINDLLIVFSS